MTGGRQTYSLEQIKDMLHARISDVAYQYAPPSADSYEDKGRYFTLNPGRPDRRVGSFYINLSGPHVGRWIDFATGQRGDLFDLIRLNLGCTMNDAIREARSFLGLQHDSPEDRRRREVAAAAARKRREDATAHEAELRDRHRRSAHALWLSGQEGLRGTPVDHYLRDRRAIDLGEIGRQPRALRYLPACRYTGRDTSRDPAGQHGIDARFPAMVAAINNARGWIVGCHRTYLALAPDGLWGKAPVPFPKKVLGDFRGAWITISNGLGPQGGRGNSLAKAPPGQTVYVTEGIEDALSVAILLPDARVICAISLSNIGPLDLPPSAAELVIVADADIHEQARDQLDRAVARHQAAGRRVRMWRNQWGGKDLNDALRASVAGAA